jgi:hypothetical protein
MRYRSARRAPTNCGKHGTSSARKSTTSCAVWARRGTRIKCCRYLTGPGMNPHIGRMVTARFRIRALRPALESNAGLRNGVSIQHRQTLTLDDQNPERLLYLSQDDDGRVGQPAGGLWKTVDGGATHRRQDSPCDLMPTAPSVDQYCWIPRTNPHRLPLRHRRPAKSRCRRPLFVANPSLYGQTGHFSGMRVSS